MTALELSSIQKHYKSIKAVDNLSLSVPEGAIYGFLGPNGAGKTTTLRMITGLIEPTGGTMQIQGQNLSFGQARGRENLGYLPDIPNFYPWMTPKEYLSFSGNLYGIEHRQLAVRVSEALELVGLSKANRRIGGYSRGMKQRLGIAQALLHKPKLVLLDEPSSALDPIGRKEVMDIIQGLAGQATVFFSTHILTDIERVCDRVAILHQGRLVAEDSVIALKQKVALNQWCITLETPEQAARLAEALPNEKWSDRASVQNDTEVVLTSRDESAVQFRLPQLITRMELPLCSMTRMTPTLEEVFLRMVEK